MHILRQDYLLYILFLSSFSLNSMNLPVVAAKIIKEFKDTIHTIDGKNGVTLVGSGATAYIYNKNLQEQQNYTFSERPNYLYYTMQLTTGGDNVFGCLHTDDFTTIAIYSLKEKEFSKYLIRDWKTDYAVMVNYFDLFLRLNNPANVSDNKLIKVGKLGTSDYQEIASSCAKLFENTYKNSIYWLDNKFNIIEYDCAKKLTREVYSIIETDHENIASWIQSKNGKYLVTKVFDLNDCIRIIKTQTGQKICLPGEEIEPRSFEACISDDGFLVMILHSRPRTLLAYDINNGKFLGKAIIKEPDPKTKLLFRPQNLMIHKAEYQDFSLLLSYDNKLIECKLPEHINTYMCQHNGKITD